MRTLPPVATPLLRPATTRPARRPANPLRVRLTGTLAGALSLLLALATTGVGFASPQSDLQAANQHVDAALTALASGDVAAARAAYARFDAAWLEVEDGVREMDRATYRSVEDAMLDVKIALRAEPVDLSAASAALERLRAVNLSFASAAGAAPPQQPPAAAADSERLTALLTQLDAARAAIGRNDAAGALAAVQRFHDDWLLVEGTVRAKSPAAYTATENDEAEVRALLRGTPPMLAEADATLLRMRERLAPIVEAGASYGVLDAFVIMLREGLEALLVIGALVAFLKKSNNGDKQRWIWGGAGAGVLLSVTLAFVLQQAFSRAGAALGTELVEGFAGIIAAAMLFYVSYWLHSKAHLGAWHRYIKDKSSAALARGSVVSLATIALLAVFREGAETAIFYLGIASSISLADLAAGISLAVVALVVAGVALLTLGMRLPLRPFFLASSALIYYLGFKFVGTGLHALQVAGILRATPAPVPSSEFFGVFPTWETLAPQVALLLLAAAILWLSARQHARGASSAPISA